LPCYRERIGERLDPQLVAFGVDETDFPGTYAVVDPVFACVSCSGYALISLLWPWSRELV
jgi:hypothetical protein